MFIFIFFFANVSRSNLSFIWRGQFPVCHQRLQQQPKAQIYSPLAYSKPLPYASACNPKKPYGGEFTLLIMAMGSGIMIISNPVLGRGAQKHFLFLDVPAGSNTLCVVLSIKVSLFFHWGPSQNSRAGRT